MIRKRLTNEQRVQEFTMETMAQMILVIERRIDELTPIKLCHDEGRLRDNNIDEHFRETGGKELLKRMVEELHEAYSAYFFYTKDSRGQEMLKFFSENARRSDFFFSNFRADGKPK